MTAKLGTVRDHGYDAEAHERRERLEGIAECSVCGEPVELWSDTEAWTEGEGGRWDHSEYGPAEGVCCGRLYVNSFEGFRVYRLREARPR